MYIVIILLIALFGVYVVISPALKKTNAKIKKEKARKAFEQLENDFELSDTDDIDQYDTLYNEMEQYNEEIYANGQEGLSGELPSRGNLLSESSIENIKVFALIKVIKKRKKKKRNGDIKMQEKNISFPVFLFSNRSNLKNGFVPMPYTSMPIGGENTLSVLCGYAKEKLFEKTKCIVSIGDKIVLQNIFEEITFSVYDIGLIEKDNIDILKIAEGETELALLMFLPNRKQRLAIFGKLAVKPTEFEDGEQGEEEYDDEEVE